MSLPAGIGLLAAIALLAARSVPVAAVPILAIAAAAALALSLGRRGGAARDGALALAVVLLATARGAIEPACLPARAPAWPPGEERSGWIEGRVLDPPEPARGGVRTRVAIERSTLGLVRGAPLLIRLGADVEPPEPGARVRAYVHAHAPSPPRSPGGFDERGWLRQRRAVAAGFVEGRSLEVVAAAPPSALGALHALRTGASARLAERVPGDGGEFLRGLLLGERGRVSPEAVVELRRAGVLHLLALSGQHVAIVAGLLAGALRAARVTGDAAFPALAGVMWAYALLTGASPSVLRATVAATVAAWAARLGRGAAGGDALAWSAALCVFAAPALAVDLGFQLSCMASVGLLAAGALERAGSTRAREWAETHDVAHRLRLLGWTKPALSLSIATAGAQLAVLPLLAWRFGATSVIGGLANLVLVPACGALLVMSLPLLALDLAAPMPGIAWKAASLLAGFTLARGHDLGVHPDAMRALALGGGGCVALYAVAAAGALAVRRVVTNEPSPAHGLAMGGVIAAAGVWMGVFAVAAVPLRPRAESTLAYWVLDVGQGDAQVLEFADGRTVLVDAGDARAGGDAGTDVVVPFLRARRIRELDLAVVTHEDRDHAGGWPSVAREIRVRTLASGRETLRALRARTPKRTARRALAAGDTLCAGPGYRVRVLWPPAGETALAANARSVVLAIEVEDGARQWRFVLTGDADSTVEARWLSAARGRAGVLKLGHHGSRSSTGSRVLAALAPRVAIVSCGRRNRFGHPHRETLARLDARTRVRRTDREGTLVLRAGPPPPPPSRLSTPRPRA